MEGIFYLFLCAGLFYVVHLLYQTEKSVNRERRELKEEIRELEIKAVSDDHKWLLATLLHVIKIRANYLKTEKNVKFDQRERHAVVRRLQNKLGVKSSVYDEISGRVSKYTELKPSDKDVFGYYLNCISDLVFSEQDPTPAELEYLKKISLDKLLLDSVSFDKYIDHRHNNYFKRLQERKDRNLNGTGPNDNTRIIDSSNSQVPTYVDDLVVSGDDNSFYQNVVSDQTNFSKSNNLKNGWNIHPIHPIKIFLIDGVPETINNLPSEKSALIINDHEFAWTNFLDYFSDDFFFHSQLKMQIPKENLDSVFLTDYYSVSDFKSEKVLGDRIERHFWSIVNSFLLESRTDDDSRIMIIFALKQLNHIYFKLGLYNQGIELMKFALKIGREKEAYHSLAINYTISGDHNNGYVNLLECCKMYIAEGEDIPNDILFDFLGVCHILGKKQEAEEFLSPLKNIDFETSWSIINGQLTLHSRIDKHQKEALKTLFQIIIELSVEPFRSEKIHRLKTISKTYKINWEEIGFDEKFTALAGNDDKESFSKLQDSSISLFSFLEALDTETKHSILAMVKYFINPVKRNGMFVEISGQEAVLLIAFAVSAELPCEAEHLEFIFSNGINFDKFYAFWGLKNPF